MAASPQAARSICDLETLELVATRATASVPVINSSTRIPALDGLRGVAILLVLLYHAVFEMHPSSKVLTHLVAAGRLAWSGVHLFFVLSGFLIGEILLDSRDSPHYFKTFYIRRAYRILPLYAVAATLFLIRFLPFHWMPGWLGKFSPTPIPWFSYLTFTQNIWMAGFGTFGVGAMAATWSLAVEEQFYLTVPLLVRKINRSHLMFVLLSVVIAAPLLRTILHLAFRNGNVANYVLMPCRADALSLGVLAALMVRNPASGNWLRTRKPILYGISGSLFVGLALLDLCRIRRDGRTHGDCRLFVVGFVLHILSANCRYRTTWARTLRAHQPGPDTAGCTRLLYISAPFPPHGSIPPRTWHPLCVRVRGETVLRRVGRHYAHSCDCEDVLEFL